MPNSFLIVKNFFYEVKETLDEKGLNEEFNKQLKKMQFQDKHKHKQVPLGLGRVQINAKKHIL